MPSRQTIMSLVICPALPMSASCWEVNVPIFLSAFARCHSFAGLSDMDVLGSEKGEQRIE